jgi:hypothetical protein
MMAGPGRKRRFQFSLASLLVLLLVVGICLGAWNATKKHAEAERDSELVDTYAFLPLVISRDNPRTGTRKYFLWLFGPTIELPFRRTIERFDNSGTFP